MWVRFLLESQTSGLITLRLDGSKHPIDYGVQGTVERSTVSPFVAGKGDTGLGSIPFNQQAV